MAKELKQTDPVLADIKKTISVRASYLTCVGVGSVDPIHPKLDK